jgi:hypothetical protein
MSKAAIILAAGPGAFFRGTQIMPARIGVEPEKCDKNKKLTRHD